MNKAKLTVIYNAFLNPQKVKDQLELIKAAAFDEKLIISFVSNSSLYSKITAQNKMQLSKKILFLDKDVALGRILESQGHKLYNSSEAIDLCDNKSYTHIALVNEKIKQPVSFLSPLTFGFGTFNKKDDFIKTIIKELGFPMVIKEIYGSFGKQVHLAENMNSLLKKLEEIQGRQFIAQKFYKLKAGSSMRIIFINGKIIGALIQNNPHDFRSNLTLGSEGEPTTVTKAIENEIIKISQRIKIFYGGIDLIYDDNNKLIFCEANSNVQLVSASKILRMNIAKVLLKEILSDNQY